MKYVMQIEQPLLRLTKNKKHIFMVKQIQLKTL